MNEAIKMEQRDSFQMPGHRRIKYPSSLSAAVIKGIPVLLPHVKSMASDWIAPFLTLQFAMFCRDWEFVQQPNRMTLQKAY